MSRVANLILGLRKRHNDTLEAINVADLAQRFRLPQDFVKRCVDEEKGRRQ